MNTSYWDNVGGPQLDAALLNLNNFGVIVACGCISSAADTSSVKVGLIPSCYLELLTYACVTHTELRASLQAQHHHPRLHRLLGRRRPSYGHLCPGHRSPRRHRQDLRTMGASVLRAQGVRKGSERRAHW